MIYELFLIKNNNTMINTNVYKIKPRLKAVETADHI